MNGPRLLRSRVARLCVLACALALTLSGCKFSVYSLPLPGGADLGSDPYTVKIEFQDVLDLVPQSAVKVADVTVGKVDSISLRDYHALVTVSLRRSVKLPDNAVAKIRQTSLLGEKFVSLSAPPGGTGRGRLGDGDLIPLARSGRNPEVEEVLGALSLILNGGGVAQLKTIATELNKALDGREGDVRSVLSELDTFMKQLDTHKDAIVTAIDKLNKLAVSLNKQKDTIDLALDELPGAVASLNRQRDDLVKMLEALSRLSDVGTRVIRASKAATIDSLRSLAPTLTKLAEAGDSLPKSLQVFLTYPFVDSVVGKNPAQARNLHMGDYTNLSIKMDVDTTNLSLPGLPGPPDLIQTCKSTPLKPVCDSLPTSAVKQICAQMPSNPLCDALGGGGSGSGGGPSLPKVPLPGLGGGGSGGSDGSGSGGSGSGGSGSGGSGGTGGSGDGGGCVLGLLCRPATGTTGDAVATPPGAVVPAGGYDKELAPLLVWGMVQR